MFIQPLTFQSAGALSILQFATADQNSFECEPADLAIGKGLVQVKETSDGGDVNSLIVLNTSEKFIFMMDGDILSGAKQNRVLNTSVLLAPHSKTVIPVSCVEHGRWHAVSTQFASTDYCAPSMLRKLKTDNVTESLKENDTFDANQGKVWSAVKDYSTTRGVHSSTSNYSDVYEAKRTEVERGLGAITFDGAANGMMFFWEKKMLHADIFNSKEVYSHYFPKLLKGVGMEFLGKVSTKKALTEAQAKYDIVEFVDGWDAAKKDPHPGAGLGTEKRAVTENYSGMQLE